MISIRKCVDFPWSRPPSVRAGKTGLAAFRQHPIGVEKNIVSHPSSVIASVDCETQLAWPTAVPWASIFDDDFKPGRRGAAEQAGEHGVRCGDEIRSGA